MNKYIGPLIFATLIGFISTNIVMAEDSPESVMTAYSEFTKKGMAEEAYQLLSKEDQKQKSLAEFKKTFSGDPETRKLIFKHTTFTFETTSSDPAQEGIVTVIQKVKSPDYSVPTARSNEIIEKNKEKKWPEVFNEQMSIYLKSDDVQYKEELVATSLKNENGQWKVFYNYKERDQQKVLTRQANALIKEGNKFLYREKKDYAKALAKYKEAQKLVPSNSYYKGLVAKYQEKVDQKNYSKLVQVNGVRVAHREKGELGIFGILDNTGDKALSLVQVTAYFLDDEGKTLTKKSYHPVLYFNEKDLEKMNIKEKSFNIPLEPNVKKKFGFKSDSPDKWQGKINVKVTEVGFMANDDLKEFRERSKK